MEAADPGGTARREPLVGRRLAELSERQGWVHHVVDADTGEVLTTPWTGPWRRSRAPSGWPGSVTGSTCPAPGDRSTDSPPGTPTRPRRSTG
jgi:hypothetical protein